MRVELSENAFLQRRHLKINAERFDNSCRYVDINGNDRSFGCPIIGTNNSQCHFIINTSMLGITKVNRVFHDKQI